MKGQLTLLLLATLAAAHDISEDLVFNQGLLLPRQSSAQNLEFFSGALGGAATQPITASGDPDQPFEVAGDKFVSLCLTQHHP